MANKKISQLTPKGSALVATDLLEVSVYNGSTYDTRSVTGANVVSGLQPTLVSGTNIKTINSTSLLGSGDIVIGGGGLTVGTTAIASGTVGRVLFQGTGNVVQQDSTLFWDNTNKRLGVGATPDTSTRLDVRAQGALSTDIAFRVRNSANTYDIIKANGAGDVYIGVDAGRVNTATQNTFIGSSSGYSNTSGQNNTVLGNQGLALNTVGNNNTALGFASLRQNTNNANTAIGSESLRYNTSGSANTAIGVEALITNTIGIQNTSTGTSSLFSNSSGNNNVGNGFGALVFNSTGSNNIAIGHNSGRYIADGSTSNAITNNSVYLGQATKALSNNQTNQIVIGDNATGLGSNTAVLGNDSITLTGLKGNVAIGATTASARLDIRAQGALSTDIALRVRNSANTGDLLSVQGDGRYALSDGGGVTSNAFSYIADGRMFMAKSGSNFIELNPGTTQNRMFMSSNGLEINVGASKNFEVLCSTTAFRVLQNCVEINSGAQASSGTNYLMMQNGTAPSANATDHFNLYSADIVAGNAAPHFRTENGNIIKLYQQTTAVASATVVSGSGGTVKHDDTFDGYTLQQVVKALRNTGILA